jgi:hypothetical protein
MINLEETMDAILVEKKKGEKTNPRPRRDAVTYGVAIGILAFYLLALIAGLVLAQSATDAVWLRTVYLLGGLEAIAFSATGFIFGKEVHRQQAERAEERAEEAEDEAQQNRQAFSNAREQAIMAEGKGRQLATFVKANLGMARTSAGGDEAFGPAAKPAPVSKEQMDAVVQLADQLFPRNE